MELNKSQLQAVCHDKGPMMVLAGPGSGKTMVITHRVKWLIEHAGVHPAGILVVTFTKAASIALSSWAVIRPSAKGPTLPR